MANFKEGKIETCSNDYKENLLVLYEGIVRAELLDLMVFRCPKYEIYYYGCIPSFIGDYSVSK